MNEKEGIQMKRDKSSFAVGDRIKFVGGADVVGFFSYKGHAATIDRIDDEAEFLNITIKWAGTEWRGCIHPRQVTHRLRKREKPAREPFIRRQKWMMVYADREEFQDSLAGAEYKFKYFPDKFIRTVHLTEIREGESLCPAGSVAVNREALERAWDKNGSNKCIYPLHENSEFFEMFCKALGIEKGGKDGR